MKLTTKKYCPIEIINQYPSAFARLYEMINRDLSEAIITEAEKGEVIVRFGEVKEEAQAEFNGMTTFRREIDIKQLVRCKDCKYYEGDSFTGFDVIMGTDKFYHCALTGHYIEEEDFCSYAKRKEEEKQ